jgi:hypothetical protein
MKSPDAEVEFAPHKGDAATDSIGKDFGLETYYEGRATKKVEPRGVCNKCPLVLTVLRRAG